VRVVIVGAMAIVLGACGPSLQAKRLDQHTFRSSRDCAQGPFSVTYTATGARWGEGLDAWIATDRPFRGRYRLELDGKRVRSGVIRVGHQAVRGSRGQRVYMAPRSRADLGRCALPEPEQIAAADEPEQGPVVQGPTMPGPAAAPEPMPQPDVVQGPAVLVPARQAHGGTRHRRRLLHFVFSLPRPDKVKTLRRGARLRLVVWSDGVIDWRNTRLTTRHYVLRPDVPEAEYIAYLREKRAERRREQEQWRRENANRRVKRRRVRRIVQRTPEQRRIAIVRARERRLVWQTRREWSKARRYVLNARKPSGPPPAPLTENAGPRPEPSARWIDGRWTWQGRQWTWIAGVWEVPPPPRAAVAVAGPRPCAQRCGPCAKKGCAKPPARRPPPVIQVRVKLGKRPKVAVGVRVR